MTERFLIPVKNSRILCDTWVCRETSLANGDARFFGALRLGQERKFSPKRKFLAGYPCGHPAKNFGQTLQILENKHFGTDILRGCPWKNFGLKSFGLIFRSLLGCPTIWVLEKVHLPLPVEASLKCLRSSQDLRHWAFLRDPCEGRQLGVTSTVLFLVGYNARKQHFNALGLGKRTVNREIVL